MAMRKSGPLDAMVGARIRMLRVNRGISQAILAERIGVTFQQVKKYEQGANRVGASRLAQIAYVLDVSVGEFFESSGAGSPRSDSPGRLLDEPDARRAPRTFARTPDSRVQPCIAKLVESTADRTSGAKITAAHLNAVDPGQRRKFPSRG
jgi:transcriptional regulator with XRE-family HTH domain